MLLFLENYLINEFLNCLWLFFTFLFPCLIIDLNALAGQPNGGLLSNRDYG